MNKLSPDATEVLAEALPGDDPSSSDRERIERRLRARLGAAVFAGGSAAAVASKASVTLAATAPAVTAGVAATSTAVGVGGGLAAKVMIAVVVATMSVGTTAFVRHRSTLQRAALVARVDNRPVVVAAPAGSAPAVSAPAVAPPPEPAADLLAVEVALMGRIRAALRESRAAEALALLDQHARSFPTGAFAEENLVGRITAFCALGRTADARRVVAQFRRELPTSAYRAQVDASCGGTHAPN